MSSCSCLRTWATGSVGKVNLTMAMARGTVRAKGPVAKLIKLIPQAKTCSGYRLRCKPRTVRTSSMQGRVGGGWSAGWDGAAGEIGDTGRCAGCRGRRQHAATVHGAAGVHARGPGNIFSGDVWKLAVRAARLAHARCVEVGVCGDERVATFAVE